MDEDEVGLDNEGGSLGAPEALPTAPNPCPKCARRPEASVPADSPSFCSLPSPTAACFGLEAANNCDGTVCDTFSMVCCRAGIPFASYLACCAIAGRSGSFATADLAESSTASANAGPETSAIPTKSRFSQLIFGLVLGRRRTCAT